MPSTADMDAVYTAFMATTNRTNEDDDSTNILTTLKPKSAAETETLVPGSRVTLTTEPQNAKKPKSTEKKSEKRPKKKKRRRFTLFGSIANFFFG